MMACRRASLEPVPFLWNDNPSKLSEMSGFIIIGGFSYEDRSRAGIIAALDPIMDQIKIQSREGKPVLGICNGAQILAEKGMIPGLKNDQIGIYKDDEKIVKIIAGKFKNQEGPEKNHNVEPIYLHVILNKDKEFKIDLPNGHNSFVYLLNGELKIGITEHQKTKKNNKTKKNKKKQKT